LQIALIVFIILCVEICPSIATLSIEDIHDAKYNAELDLAGVGYGSYSAQ
jgi:hypothetical protein